MWTRYSSSQHTEDGVCVDTAHSVEVDEPQVQEVEEVPETNDDVSTSGSDTDAIESFVERLCSVGIPAQKHYTCLPMIEPKARILWLQRSSMKIFLTTQSEKERNKPLRPQSGIRVDEIRELVIGPTPYVRATEEWERSSKCLTIVADNNRVMCMNLTSTACRDRLLARLTALIVQTRQLKRIDSVSSLSEQRSQKSEYQMFRSLSGKFLGGR